MHATSGMHREHPLPPAASFDAANVTRALPSAPLVAATKTIQLRLSLVRNGARDFSMRKAIVAPLVTAVTGSRPLAGTMVRPVGIVRRDWLGNDIATEEIPVDKATLPEIESAANTFRELIDLGIEHGGTTT